MKRPIWCDEVFDNGLRMGAAVKQVLFNERSEFQQVTIVDTLLMGRALMLDGLWMTSEKDERHYHELLVQPVMTAHPAPRRVLIIGGGDGGTAREVLLHPDVERVEMVEIDGAVVQACQEHLPTIGTAWNDPRLDVRIEDGISAVKHGTADAYDVIIVDGSDPEGPAVGLFDASFFEGCNRLLAPGGVLVTQGESPLFQKETHFALLDTLSTIFRTVEPYYGTVTLYPGGSWSWIAASQGTSIREPNRDRLGPVRDAEVYNADVHRGAFAIPNYVRQHMERQV